MIDPEAVYDLESVKMPYLAGRPLKLFASFLAGSAGGAASKSLLDSAAGLPIGMQAMGRHWQEATLLRLALAAERVVERRRPQIFFDLGGF